MKLQAAMEYLTTYSWAIIIIIGVLSALFALGVFDTSNFTGRASPGSCQIYRPYGAGSSQLVNLQGVCSGLEPKSVALFSNTIPGQITIPTAGLLQGNSITISLWVKFTSSSPYMLIDRGPMGSIGTFYITGSPANPDFRIYSTAGAPFDTIYSASPFQLATWYNLAATFNPNTGIATDYINGQPVSSTAAAGLGLSTANIIFGNYIAAGNYGLNGELSNIQMYNSSLSGNEVYRMYVAGIGGAPIQLQNLVGWWPLNGDVNDYSGNGNQGIASGIAFSTAWIVGYQLP